MAKKINPAISCVFFFMMCCFGVAAQGQTKPATVKIGQQQWMAENLNVDTFRNGDPIPHAKTDEEWKKAYEEHKPAWCYYGNDPENELKYGKLYNWFAVSDPRGLAPKGYHVPSKADWETLVDFLGGQKMAGKKLKSTEGWPGAENGTNESGFDGRPGSMRYYSGYFDKNRCLGRWWTKTELESSYAWQYYLLKGDEVGWYSADYGKGAGMSVRCLAD
ncbi:fibrobacter succinogenes major paralogous domain-containing protein [Flavobacterium sp. MAH-1]|uniref:Fibrobacter succinogenes major paralogous domain-containing protein n=1 Tax=Flavobacterium agri TaxID=2743471 RepID=A0A7Y8Y0T3_9FLAO|nr:fibrobacter succinogenes major paralogous domain-containing protein [Flavobacterium agri]NUY80486.1 fibrobacter succinogenes major paralogous domain-containing protein [Flavobacterium agri]NYA70511.1 fibrobacter succinogenes major paralogous domain-containing protein [Flavobacterium agri]